MTRRVLMVCEANICRSPLAAALLAREVPKLDVKSAGTHALVGRPADESVIEVAREHGIALDQHVATQLDESGVREADLIFTMTRAQREWVEATWPEARGKVIRLCDEQGADVIDPYGRHRTVAALAFAQIRSGVLDWSRKLAEPQ